MSKLYLLLTLILLSSCVPDQSASFTITGNLPNTDYLVFIQEEDIEKKISKTIDTIFPDKEGYFKKEYNLPPYLYTIIPHQQKKISLAIDHGQVVKLAEGNTEIKVTGSPDTALLAAYESFRKRSLDSLVSSVRKQISKERKSEQPHGRKIDSLSQLEIRNYNKHLDELTDHIDKNLGSSIGVYTTALRWKGGQNIEKL